MLTPAFTRKQNLSSTLFSLDYRRCFNFSISVANFAPRLGRCFSGFGGCYYCITALFLWFNKVYFARCGGFFPWTLGGLFFLRLLSILLFPSPDLEFFPLVPPSRTETDLVVFPSPCVGLPSRRRAPCGSEQSRLSSFVKAPLSTLLIAIFLFLVVRTTWAWSSLLTSLLRRDASLPSLSMSSPHFCLPAVGLAFDYHFHSS